MIGTGTYVNGVFEATEILAKHDETYMPKEVVDALKEQGVYKSPAKAERPFRATPRIGLEQEEALTTGPCPQRCVSSCLPKSGSFPSGRELAMQTVRDRLPKESWRREGGLRERPG